MIAKAFRNQILYNTIKQYGEMCLILVSDSLRLVRERWLGGIREISTVE